MKSIILHSFIPNLCFFKSKIKSLPYFIGILLFIDINSWFISLTTYNLLDDKPFKPILNSTVILFLIPTLFIYISNLISSLLSSSNNKFNILSLVLKTLSLLILFSNLFFISLFLSKSSKNLKNVAAKCLHI